MTPTNDRLTPEELKKMRGCIGLDFPPEAIERLFATITALEAERDNLRAQLATARAALPDPDRLVLLADWFDLYDTRHRDDFTGNHSAPCGMGYSGRSSEVQSDLRVWARNIRALPDAGGE